jgi:hypothetical protein
MKPKIGSGSLQAFLRQGLKELAQVLPAFPDSVKVSEEIGALGNPPPQLVTEQMREGTNEKQPEPEMEP